jgi:hypothetical protein
MTDKFCKDCRHFRESAFSGTDAGRRSGKCFRPIPRRRKDLVFGDRKSYLDKSAWLERLETRPMFKWLFPDNCGPDAKYFEPRQRPEPPQPMKETAHD